MKPAGTIRRFPLSLARWCYDLNRLSWRLNPAIWWLNLIVVKQASSPVKWPVYRRIRVDEQGSSLPIGCIAMGSRRGLDGSNRLSIRIEHRGWCQHHLASDNGNRLLLAIIATEADQKSSLSQSIVKPEGVTHPTTE